MNRAKFRHLILFIVLSLVWLTGLIACSDRTPPPGTGGSSQTIGDMDGDELSDFCDDIVSEREAGAEILAEGSCKAFASELAREADDPELTCQNNYDSCIDDEQNVPESSECLFENEGVENLNYCEATSSDYFDCLNEQIEAAETIAESFSCEDAGQSFDDELQEALVDLAGDGDACVSFFEDCHIGPCPEDEQLVAYDGDEFCTNPCSSDDECASDEECLQDFCLPEDGDDDVNQLPNSGNNNQEDNDNDDNGSGTDCDPQQACQDYCYNKSGRCIENSCGDPEIDGESFADIEVFYCMEGLEDPDGNTIVEGCLEKAQWSDAACENVQADADNYASQSCSHDDQQRNQCSDLLTYRLEGGEQLFDECGCTPASTARSCTIDSDCDDYGRGICQDNGLCTAECYDFEGNPPTGAFPDPTCGSDDHGLCYYPDGAQSGICQLWCAELEDCPSSSYCVPFFEVDGGTTGLCGDYGDDPDIEHCGRSGDTSCPAGNTCREGVCYPECSSDSDCEDFETCQGGYCDPNLVPLY